VILKEQYQKNKDLVTLKESKVYPGLFVLKYKKKVFFDDSWNDFLREARGLVVDKDWNIVSYPFTKIHNYGVEESAPKFGKDEIVIVSEKINGFMIAVTWHNGDLLWSTTGSLDSDFVGYAKDIFGSWSERQQSNFKAILEADPNWTFMFECVHPEDPHIVHEEPGLYFIGTRYKEIGSRIWLHEPFLEKQCWVDTGVKLVECFETDMGNLFELAENSVKEGYVFCDRNRVNYSKIKTKHYLTKKFLMRGSLDKILSKNPKNLMDEEFYPIVDWIRTYPDSYTSMIEMERRKFIEDWFSYESNK
jgi:hypothetical protein